MRGRMARSRERRAVCVMGGGSLGRSGESVFLGREVRERSGSRRSLRGGRELFGSDPGGRKRKRGRGIPGCFFWVKTREEDGRRCGGEAGRGSGGWSLRGGKSGWTSGRFRRSDRTQWRRVRCQRRTRAPLRFPGRILTKRRRGRRMARITISLMLKGFGYFLTKEEEEERKAAKSMAGYFYSDSAVSEASGGLASVRRVSGEGEGAV